MGLTGQRGRVEKALSAKWPSLRAAGVALGFANNYFSRADWSLEPEVAVRIEAATNYRAAWLMFGELPEKIGLGGDLRAAAMEGRREAIEEAIEVLRAIQGAARPEVATPATGPSEGVTVPEAEAMRRELLDQGSIPPEVAKPARKRRKA